MNSFDYALLLAVVLPLAAFIFFVGPQIMGLVYEMTCVLVGWPLL